MPKTTSAGRVRPPTMADVAALAGVSPQTVSRVLRDHPNVSEVTRLQVENAVESTGYRRTGLARALVTGRSMTIGVLTHESDQYAASSIMLGIHRAARARGYFVSSAGTTSVSAAAIAGGIGRLRDQGVDALVIAVPIWDEPALAKAVHGIPTAVIDADTSAADVVVDLDQEAAGRLATQHLIDLGHETVWHIAGPANWKDASGRTQGWAAALAEAGKTAPPVLNGDWTPASGYQLGLVLGRVADATAVFVSSDEMAIGVIHALRELGRDVPGDISVVAMDDIPVAQYLSPPLTTVRQPFERMGELAVERVIAELDGDADEQRNAHIAPELIVRGSTAPPAR
ncbi:MULTISPECIES: LacI family DNA-binding transcriptional regulator [Microbacterium]|uniref:Substrate-binding domain-containing protein n=1 Tax=Microbacterium galbinum TaxID=2851646 RepID=A0ABY4IM96_9MICO|nr:substrate-binding domain-containing protein [Microbacterium galbinum]MCK2023684.1 substrate-binding domain-containing protein [Microbacterium galbinum]UPL13909.1 substrate-binding domain-containing protein [Microbacterium galbinum]